MARKKIDFEDRLQLLEDLVEQLEAGELSLEDSLKAFEQGVKLTRECQMALNEAKQRVAILTQSQEGWQMQPFEQTDEPTAEKGIEDMAGIAK